MQAYIIVIPGLGTKVLFPWYGAKGGGADKTAPGGMFEGCEFWFAGSSERVVEWLHEMFYCNQKAGLEKCKQNAPLRYKHMEAAVTADTRVNPDCWMVRLLYPCCLRRSRLTILAASHSHNFVTSSSATSTACTLYPVSLAPFSLSRSCKRARTR